MTITITESPALTADGHHARVDGFVSLGVIVAAGAIAIGLPRGDPTVGLVITALILRITWQAWNTVRHDQVD
ncbi:MAG: cation transporter [Acidimicrobiia bacterium]